jgi:hypothetical protein
MRMRLLTTGALGIAALAVAAAVRRSRTAKPREEVPGARVEAQSLVTWFVRVPPNTPAQDPISICGNLVELGGWNARGMTLRPVGARLYRAALHVPRGTVMEYKITRGSWGRVEKCRDGSERTNRRMLVARDEEVNLEVERWSDLL